jgi:hypothetical protein
LNSLLLADPRNRASILGLFSIVGAARATAPNGVSFLVVEFS